jgi:hypothetical protein
MQRVEKFLMEAQRFEEMAQEATTKLVQDQLRAASRERLKVARELAEGMTAERLANQFAR